MRRDAEFFFKKRMEIRQSFANSQRDAGKVVNGGRRLGGQEYGKMPESDEQAGMAPEYVLHGKTPDVYV